MNTIPKVERCRLCRCRRFTATLASVLHPMVLVVLMATAMLPVHAAAQRNEPLDFAYRVVGAGIAIGVVFDDGRDMFIQPVDPSAATALHVHDAPYAVQGPYLVVRGLANRLALSTDTSRSKPILIEYTGSPRAETATRDCAAVPDPGERRVLVPFATGALHTEPGGIDQLARVLGEARGADRVTIVAFGDRSQSPIALRRATRVRDLLIAAGVAPGSIDQRVQGPAASSVEVIVVRHPAVRCPSSQPVRSVTASPRTDPIEPSPAADAGASSTVVPLSGARLQASIEPALAQAIEANPEFARPVSDADRRKAVQQIMALVAQGRISEQIAAALVVAAAGSSAPAPAPSSVATRAHPALLPTVQAAPGDAAPAGHAPSDRSSASAPAEPPAADASSTPPLRLMFLPNTTVQATLRTYLRAHGIDVEFRSMPLLMVEAFAVVDGDDLRDVLRRALARLGLRGEIQGNRLLVVELASQK